MSLIFMQSVGAGGYCTDVLNIESAYLDGKLNNKQCTFSLFFAQIC